MSLGSSDTSYSSPRPLRQNNASEEKFFYPENETSQAPTEVLQVAGSLGVGDSILEKASDISEVVANLKKDDTIFYLAYGSNLAASTFLGVRGIRPLSQVNVVVPALRLTFDLAGIPYREPCFANTADRYENETLPNYHKNRWNKGLVGVVYKLTAADFSHVIATEGGGASYKDIVVDCFPMAAGTKVVPETPTGTPVKAHTLFAPDPNQAPPGKPGDPPPKKGSGRLKRPNMYHAQASARYMNLLKTGADEHDLPPDYKEYLHQIRPFRLTSMRQRIGGTIFLAIWTPILLSVTKLIPLFANKEGKSPRWLSQILASLFVAIWTSYDNVFKVAFGEGERTESDKDYEANPYYNADHWHSQADQKVVVPFS